MPATKKSFSVKSGLDANANSISNLGASSSSLALSGGHSVVLTTGGATTLTLPTSGTLLYNGGALGTPASGNLANCTFPTLNQNTSGSSGSCTGNAATATTATNQSGGTVSATTGNFSQYILAGTGTAIAPSSVAGVGGGQVTDSTSGFSAPGIVIGSGTGSHGAIVYGSGIMYFGTENGSASGTMTTRATLTNAGAFNTIGAITQNGSQVLHSGNYSSSITSLTAITNISTGAAATAGTITGDWSLGSGSKLRATYADLAENYVSDQQYDYGIVLMIGGDEEVTIADEDTQRLAGVVSQNPAYLMNSECEGKHVVAIALQGRTPVRVKGKVNKGDFLVSAGDGYAKATDNPKIGSIIGKSLESFDGEYGMVEAMVGRL